MDEATQASLKGSFNRAAVSYATSRPTYPEAAVDWLLMGRCGDVLDLGAGSGPLIRALTARARRLVAVEPSRNLLTELRTGLPGVPAIRASAERLPIAPGAFDVVTVATAFHWFDAGRALPEIAGVLRRGGHLALVWNTRALTAPWTQELDRLLRSAQPPALSGDWGTDSAHALDDSEWFEPPASAEFDHAQVLDRDGLLGLVGSRSYVISLAPPDRAVLLADVSTLFDAHAGSHGTVELPYRTQCWRSVLRTGRALLA